MLAGAKVNLCADCAKQSQSEAVERLAAEEADLEANALSEMEGIIRKLYPDKITSAFGLVVGVDAILSKLIQSPKSSPGLSAIRVLLVFLFWCSCNQVFADSHTFVALSLRNCEREIASCGGDANKLKEANPGIYFLATINRPAFVVFDEDSKDAILVGEQTQDKVVLTMDDWITALRAAIIHPEEDPGVTIDPFVSDADKQKGMFASPNASTQHVRFFAGLENTQFGEICYEADWWMKLLAAGKIQSPVDGVRSFIDLVGEDAEAHKINTTLLQTRFWFYPIIDRVNLLDNLVLLQDFQMGVFTQIMYAEEDGHPVLDLSHQYDVPSDKFATSLTKSFGTLAESQDVLASLRELTRLSAIAKGCARSSCSFKFEDFIKNYKALKVTTPTNKEVVVQRDLNRRLEFRGGVELKALALRLAKGDASALRQIVLKARPSPNSASWKFIISLQNGVPEGVNILPQSGSDSDAAELLAQGTFLYINNRFDDAVKCCDSILMDFPNSEEAACMKAISLREGTLVKAGQSPANDFKQIQASTQILEDVLKRDPRCVQAIFELGVTHRAFRFQTNAIDDFQKAIKLSPDFGAAHYMLGLTWKDMGNYTNAMDCFQTVLSIESDTETAKDAAEQLALVQQSLKAGGKRTLKEYTLRQQGFSLRYPDDWLALTPEEVQKRVRGNMVLTPACVLVVANPDNWGQNLTIQISDAAGTDSLSPETLESFVPGLREHLEQQLDDFKEVSHKIIEVAEVPALEFDCTSIGWGKRQRQRSVAFVKQQRMFTITCTAADSEFTDADTRGFQFIIDTLKIEPTQP
jgi:tetratricopeptide (TPR) repeat protein